METTTQTRLVESSTESSDDSDDDDADDDAEVIAHNQWVQKVAAPDWSGFVVSFVAWALLLAGLVLLFAYYGRP